MFMLIIGARKSSIRGLLAIFGIKNSVTVIMLSVVMLIVIMLNVEELNIILGGFQISLKCN